MIRSKVFKLIDLSNQKRLREHLRDWIHVAKREPGVNSYTDTDDKKKYYLISLGERPNLGHQIGLKKVEETDRKIVVYIEEIFPSLGGFYPMVIAYPYLLVEVEKPLEVWLIREGKASLFFS